MLGNEKGYKFIDVFIKTILMKVDRHHSDLFEGDGNDLEIPPKLAAIKSSRLVTMLIADHEI